MHLIEVTPLLRATKINSLSYYSATPYPVGTFLQVPIRNKLQRAIVIRVESVNESKTSLRQASFTLQKLPPQEQVSTVPETVRQTAHRLSHLYPATAGALLFQLLPPEILTGSYTYPNISTLIHHEDVTPQVLTASTSERFVIYRTHIRSILARRGSVMFVAPTSTALDKAYAALAKGIEDRIVVFSPNQTKKARQESYAQFEDTSVAKLILATPSHAYLDRVDLLSVIIEEEGSDTYTSRRRPYLDHRIALTLHAKDAGRSLILGDILPRSETESARRNETYSTYDHETKRLTLPSPLSVIEQKDKPTPDAPFSLFSKELKARIHSTLERPGRVFLFGARRGLAPVVACIDCGHIFRCPDAKTPYSLIRTHDQNGNQLRWFVSGTSGKKIRAADTCSVCGSWRLRERGIGIQSVFDECLTNFPQAKIFLFDHLKAATKKRAEAIIKEFQAERAAILVGTQMSVSYLEADSVDLAAVVSFDATRSIQTWQADEKTLRLLLNLREVAHKNVLVQTRSTPDDLLRYSKNGSIDEFYTEELALRESLNYPPFATFILLSWRGTPETVKQVETEIKTLITTFTSTNYNNPLSTSEDILRHALFRLDPTAKNNPDLIAILRHLPPYIKIEINPSRIV